MQTDQAPNFGPIARFYRWMEYCSFGPMLERCRFAQLNALGSSRQALVLGDGDGRFLEQLLLRCPRLHADVVELSAAMIALASQRVAGIGAMQRTSFHREDVRTVTLPKSKCYDLITAHFFLDCLTDLEVETLLSHLKKQLSPGAIFIVSEFAFPSKGPLRLAARLLIGSLYFAFRLMTGLRVRRLPQYTEALHEAGFLPEDTRLFLGGILRSERWRLNS